MIYSFLFSFLFFTLARIPPTLFTTSALDSGRGHFKHERNPKGPPWGRGPLGAPFGAPLERWHPPRRFLAEAWRQPHKFESETSPREGSNTLTQPRTCVFFGSTPKGLRRRGEERRGERGGGSEVNLPPHAVRIQKSNTRTQ